MEAHLPHSIPYYRCKSKDILIKRLDQTMRGSIHLSTLQECCRGIAQRQGFPRMAVHHVVRRPQQYTWNRNRLGMTSPCIPPVSATPVFLDVTGLFAASTAYTAAIACFLLYKATVEPLRMRGAASGEESIMYSADQLQRGNLDGSWGSAHPSPLPMLMPLIAVYMYLLIQSYEPDMVSLILPGSLKDGFSNGFNPQFFPKIQGIATLFSRVTTTASLWVHLLCINIFAAHHLMWEGISRGIPTHHTILLSILCGPLGLVSHGLTLLVQRR